MQKNNAFGTEDTAHLTKVQKKKYTLRQEEHLS